MFHRITLFGREASVLWGYHTAVAIKSWRIAKAKDGRWTLTATCMRVEPFQARQKPLLFIAPREGGYWAWAIESLTVNGLSLVAQLGPPEQ